MTVADPTALNEMTDVDHEDKGYLVRSSATSWSQKDGDETDTLLREASLAIRRTGRPLVCDREGRYARCIMTIPEGRTATQTIGLLGSQVNERTWDLDTCSAWTFVPALIRGNDPLTIDSKAAVTMNTPGVRDFSLNGHQICTCARGRS